MGVCKGFGFRVPWSQVDAGILKEERCSGYLLVKRDAVLAVEDGTVDAQRGELPEFALVVAWYVEDGSPRDVFQRCARGMVGSPTSLLPCCPHQPLGYPVHTNKNKWKDNQNQNQSNGI